MYNKNIKTINNLIEQSNQKEEQIKKLFNFYLVKAVYRNKCLVDRGNITFIRKNPITKEELNYINFLCNIINNTVYEELNPYDLDFFDYALGFTYDKNDIILKFIHSEMLIHLRKIYNCFHSDIYIKIGYDEKTEYWIERVKTIFNKYNK